MDFKKFVPYLLGAVVGVVAWEYLGVKNLVGSKSSDANSFSNGFGDDEVNRGVQSSTVYDGNRRPIRPIIDPVSYPPSVLPPINLPPGYMGITWKDRQARKANVIRRHFHPSTDYRRP